VDTSDVENSLLPDTVVTKNNFQGNHLSYYASVQK